LMKNSQNSLPTWRQNLKVPKKSALFDWTYSKCWNSGEEPQKVICEALRGRWGPPPFPHRSRLYINIGSALWNSRWTLRPAPLGPRYHRAFCLGRRVDPIRWISQASNVKEPTRFMVTSWIVGSDKGHDSAIWSVFFFCYRTSTSTTLCQDEK
jgi:hypothetical protein